MIGATFRRLMDRKIKSITTLFKKIKRTLWVISVTEGKYETINKCYVCGHELPDVMNHKSKWMIKCPICKTHTKPSYSFMETITKWNRAKLIPYEESLGYDYTGKI